MELVSSILDADRWNVLCSTPWALRHVASEFLDGPVCVVEQAWRWRGQFHAWATMSRSSDPPWHWCEGAPPARNSPVCEVWGPVSGRKLYHPGVLFSALYDDRLQPSVPSLMGPKQCPQPANALFLALDKIVEECGGRHIRVFGAAWSKGMDRWQLWSLANCRDIAANHGIKIEIVEPIVFVTDDERGR